MAMNVKKGDTVIVLSGKDKGKQGKVLGTVPSEAKVVVEGINPNAFDGRGNYAMGIKEQLIFPEIEYDKIDKIRGMDIVICTTAQTDEEARELLTLVGAPFER